MSKISMSSCSHLWAGALLFGSLTVASAAPAVAPPPTGPVVPPPGTTLVDRLDLQTGELRTFPRVPHVGAWGLLVGLPTPGPDSAGIEVDKPGQALVYPTADLLSGPMGTIEFSVVATTPVGADQTLRQLLDSWPVAGNARWQVTLTGNKIELALTNDANATKTIDGTANWTDKTPHRVTIIWDATDVSMFLDGGFAGRIDKAVLPTQEPLGLSLGNSRDFQHPLLGAVSSLRLSTAREQNAAPVNEEEGGAIPDDERKLKMSQDYGRRLYPLLERLRQQNVVEVNFAYALAYRDIEDLDRAMQTITPIASDANSPLHVQAVFLRADLLTDMKDYQGAFEQLQVLTGNADIGISVRAQVKQAAILYEEGNKSESKTLIGEIIARYPEMPAINDAYLMIGLNRFQEGNFEQAFDAFNYVGKPGAPPRASVAIGTPLEIKVSDPKLGARIADVGLPVTVTSTSGDTEQVVLRAAFSRGVYIGSIDTVLGEAKPGDGVLQLEGGDKIQISYTDHLAEGDQTRTVSLETATDGKLIVLSRSALDVYREVQSYQLQNVLDDRWSVIGKLPKTASAFFRDSDDGTLRRKGFTFDKGFISSIKPGQSLYIELNDPDEDKTGKPDTVKIELKTLGGKTLPVTLTETDNHTGIFTATVKTTPFGQPVDGMLEVKFDDIVTGTYVDARPAEGTRDPTHVSSVNIRSIAGTIVAGYEITDPDDEARNVFVRAFRESIDGTPVTVKVEDRDLDVTDQPDKVTVKAHSASGGDFDVVLTETGDHTGVYTGVMKLSAAGAPDALKAKQGDPITIQYLDEENPTGQPVTREYDLKANVPEDATVILARQIIDQPKIAKGASPSTSLPPPKITFQETTAIVPNSVYRVTLIDRDIIPLKAGDMFAKIVLKSSNGSLTEVPLRAAFENKSTDMSYTGDFYARLGDTGSPSRAFFSQTGTVADIKDDNAYGLFSLPAVNLQGKDTVKVVYEEPLAADGRKDVQREWPMRVADDATLTVLNMQGNPLDDLKPGMPFELDVADATGDTTAKRDSIKATITSSGGDRQDIDLLETDIHSGVFSAIVKTAPVGVIAASAGANQPLTVPFDGKVTISYADTATISGTPDTKTLELTTQPLGEAEGVLLTKIYDDPKFEVETLVRLGESLYAVGAAELATTKTDPGQPRTNAKMKEAARLLQQVVDRFPTSDYVVESLFLTGKIRREEQKFDDAKKLFQRVINEYPDSELVPDAEYQLVLLNYDANDIAGATEAATKLIYGYPKNPQVAEAFLRIAEFYYNKKDYLTAAYIYKRVIDRFPDNPRIDLIHYRMATAYYRAGLGTDKSSLAMAVRYYLEFVDTYKDSDLADDALYWAANASLKQGATQQAYNLLTKLLITYPDGDMKAYATRLRDQIKEDNPTIEAEIQ